MSPQLLGDFDLDELCSRRRRQTKQHFFVVNLGSDTGIGITFGAQDARARQAVFAPAVMCCVLSLRRLIAYAAIAPLVPIYRRRLDFRSAKSIH
jgi:hypothetical protein